MLARARRGRTYLIGSPTSVLMQDTTFPTFKALAQDLGVWNSDAVKLTPYPTVELTTGATARFRTADDPEKLRGPNLSGVWLDEASLMEHEAFLISIASLREAGDQGWLSATFTPKGRSHWTYDVFGKGRPGSAMFQSRTSDNPFLPRAFAEQIRTQYSGLRAQQELEGEFVNIEGAEWPAEYFGPGIWFDVWPAQLTCKVMMLDPSKGRDAKSGDFRAFVFLGRDRDGHLWVDADLDRQPTPIIVEEGIEFARRFRPHAFGVEANVFQELLADDMARVSRERGVMLPLFLINNQVNKLVRIRRLGPYLQRGLLHFKAGSSGAQLLVQQLQDFPEAEHDDGPDALEGAVRLMDHMLSPVDSGEAEVETVRT